MCGSSMLPLHRQTKGALKQSSLRVRPGRRWAGLSRAATHRRETVQESVTDFLVNAQLHVTASALYVTFSIEKYVSEARDERGHACERGLVKP